MAHEHRAEAEPEPEPEPEQKSGLAVLSHGTGFLRRVADFIDQGEFAIG